MDRDYFNSFEPVHFLRTHSRNNDSADVQTQVWDCCFELDDDNVKRFYSGAHTFATCGGNSICFIDCITGSVISKYYAKDPSVSFFCLAWSSLKDDNKRRSVLAAGTSKTSLFIFDCTLKRCVLEHKFHETKRKQVSLNALHFHRTEKQVLFCGFSDGAIRLCELKRDVESTYSLKVNNYLVGDEEVLDLTFCLTTKFLLVSRSDGLHIFHYPSKESLITATVNKSVKVDVACRGKASTNSLVDCIEILKDGLFACKYALQGCIYICDLKSLKDATNLQACKHVEIEPLHILSWSNTDNYYMHMGVNIESNILCCGDDKGSLWLYDLSGTVEYNFDTSPPSAIIPWPEVTDHYNDKKSKLKLEAYDIVIDKVAIHSSGNYIVAVTNNNLVCIWKKDVNY